MPSGITGGESFQLLARALDLRQAAHERSVENLAHQDTPGFKARHLEFNGALKQALGATLSLKGGRQGHIGTGPNRIAQVTGEQQVVTTGASQDGNTVSPDDEMSRLAENTLMYNVGTQIIGAKYRALRNVIHEGR